MDASYSGSTTRDKCQDDETRVAETVVHKEEEIIIRLNDSASVLDAEMTTIQVVLENASETSDKITIHTI